MIKIPIYLISLFVLGIIVFPHGAQAHGEGVTTFKATTADGYVIDVDYAGLGVQAGVSGTFDFNLFTDESRTKRVEYKDLWVRIVEQDGSSQGRTLFAGPIAKPQYKQEGFLYVFPHEGSYTLAVRYNQANEENVSDKKEIKADLSIKVARSPEEEKFSLKKDFYVGLAVGGMGVLVFLLPFLIRRRDTSDV
jgi:hypothetical protein